MRIKALCVLLVGVVFGARPDSAAAAEGTVPVIIDTDASVDDARAVAMLLESPKVDVRAILISDGGSSPCDGVSRISRVLSFLGRSAVPLGIGPASAEPPPSFRPDNQVLEGLGGGSVRDCSRFPDAVKLAGDTLRKSDAPAAWVALGPLSSLAALVRSAPELKAKIRQVYFSGTIGGDAAASWNAERDPDAARVVSESGLVVFCLPESEAVRAGLGDAVTLAAARAVDSRAARLLGRLEDQPRMREIREGGRARSLDDALAVAVMAPESFTIAREGANPLLARLAPSSPEAVRKAFMAAFERKQNPTARTAVVLKRVPAEPPELADDVAAASKEIVSRHGAEEWSAAVVACELHRRLAPWAIVGVKMGVRARELFKASLDEVSVESLAGSKPPLSGLNDGLQAASDATVGRGTMRVTDSAPRPEAVFTKGRTGYRLTLKPAVQAAIEDEIRQAADELGAGGPAYFEEMRRIAIRLWLELDRNAVFGVVKENPPEPPPEQKPE